MKVHYINILLFSLPLNILEHNPWNHYMKPHTYTNRSLCECELYELANYDNDPQMKEVMENFIKQTQPRFEEYDERMKTTRQKCKDKCDKEIQKIILKDKLEKQMAQQLTTLDPNITTEDIPTCICEKSLADKTEKFCLNCGKTMGGVAPGWGLVSGLGYVGWTNYVTQTALQKGIEEGVKYGIQELKYFPGLSGLIKFSEIKNLINHTNYANRMTYITFVKSVNSTKCVDKAVKENAFCNYLFISNENALSQRVSGIAKNAADMAKHAETEVLNASASSLTTFSNAIIASIVAIVVIVLVMVIIYLILRYLRKKKMKKKLEYIKLLKE
ncbi:rifin [Plasmodium falciparum HB3]|uniref:Rifin n=1 Tax=Plasmodium falciparum (isolate HB3) TaxID=137071 RepID=A0A0L7KIE8_PLAFX|nr:rifin [Plasmodium falciparum HB3]